MSRVSSAVRTCSPPSRVAPSTEPLYISDRMVSQRTGTLLDDTTIEEVERALGRPVVPAADLSDVARDLRTRARRQALVAA